MANANTTNVPITVPVNMTVNGTRYAGSKNVVYTAREGKGGAFK
jgi:hypothetical protein